MSVSKAFFFFSNLTLLCELTSLNFPWESSFISQHRRLASISIKSMNYYLYRYILQTSRKKSPLDKVFYSKLFHTDSNKANVVGLKAWMNCGNLLDVEATGGSSKPSHEKDHTGLLLPKAFQLDILKKKDHD